MGSILPSSWSSSLPLSLRSRFLDSLVGQRSTRLKATLMGILFVQFLIIYLVILSCIEIGRARIVNPFVRSKWPSVDIPLDNDAFVAPKGHNAPQQVHITQGDYDGKAVLISWVTTEEPGSSEVQYGKLEHQYDLSAEGTLKNYTFYRYKSGYIHHCLIDGLEYSMKYYYKIGIGDSAREFWFQTPPKIDPDAPYTFGIIGTPGA